MARGYFDPATYEFGVVGDDEQIPDGATPYDAGAVAEMNRSRAAAQVAEEEGGALAAGIAGFANLAAPGALNVASRAMGVEDSVQANIAEHGTAYAVGQVSAGVASALAGPAAVGARAASTAAERLAAAAALRGIGSPVVQSAVSRALTGAARSVATSSALATQQVLSESIGVEGSTISGTAREIARRATEESAYGLAFDLATFGVGSAVRKGRAAIAAKTDVAQALRGLDDSIELSRASDLAERRALATDRLRDIRAQKKSATELGADAASVSALETAEREARDAIKQVDGEISGVAPARRKAITEAAAKKADRLSAARADKIRAAELRAEIAALREQSAIEQAGFARAAAAERASAEQALAAAREEAAAAAAERAAADSALAGEAAQIRVSAAERKLASAQARMQSVETATAPPTASTARLGDLSRKLSSLEKSISKIEGSRTTVAPGIELVKDPGDVVEIRDRIAQQKYAYNRIVALDRVETNLVRRRMAQPGYVESAEEAQRLGAIHSAKVELSRQLKNTGTELSRTSVGYYRQTGHELLASGIARAAESVNIAAMQDVAGGLARSAERRAARIESAAESYASASDRLRLSQISAERQALRPQARPAAQPAPSATRAEASIARADAAASVASARAAGARANLEAVALSAAPQVPTAPRASLTETLAPVGESISAETRAALIDRAVDERLAAWAASPAVASLVGMAFGGITGALAGPLARGAVGGTVQRGAGSAVVGALKGTGRMARTARLPLRASVTLTRDDVDDYRATMLLREPADVEHEATAGYMSAGIDPDDARALGSWEAARFRLLRDTVLSTDSRDPASVDRLSRTVSAISDPRGIASRVGDGSVTAEDIAVIEALAPDIAIQAALSAADEIAMSDGSPVSADRYNMLQMLSGGASLLGGAAILPRGNVASGPAIARRAGRTPRTRIDGAAALLGGGL